MTSIKILLGIYIYIYIPRSSVSKFGINLMYLANDDIPYPHNKLDSKVIIYKFCVTYY